MHIAAWSLVPIGVTWLLVPSPAAGNDNGPPRVAGGAGGVPTHVADAPGDTVPDFSNCGYRGGDEPLPEVPVVVELEPLAGDDTFRIQQALDAAAERPPDAGGFRGAVLLRQGEFDVAGTLALSSSGVVLRGTGSGTGGTIVRATGRTQRPLLHIKGAGPPGALPESTRRIVQNYVPVGARRFEIDSANDFAVGDTIQVRRHGNAAWISAIGMDRIAPRRDSVTVEQWRPFTISFDRVVTAIDRARIAVDAPIVCAIEKRWGGGLVLKYEDTTRVSNVGVEHLRLVSEFDASVTAARKGVTYFADEQHAWEAVLIDQAVNVWVRDVVASHFGFGCVHVRYAKWVTVQDCTCLEMVSRIDGNRRYPFYFYGGQLCLARNCTASGGRHDFAFGAYAWGPNVFLDCYSSQSFNFSEPHFRWSVGGLYDNVHSPIAVQDRGNWGGGHGWAGANYVLWNCEGPLIAQAPPFARTWVVGHVGECQSPHLDRQPATFDSFGLHVQPRSLYLQQLAERRAAGKPQH
jgi:hypothetical protein